VTGPGGRSRPVESGPGGRSRPAEPDPGLEAVLRPGGIGSLELPHRIVTGAMHLGIERRDDGGAAMAAFYAARARGGAGLMVTGGAAVNRVGAGGRAYAVLDDPADQARLGRVADEVHAAGGLIALQLFHAGRYAFEATYGLQPVAPSAVYSRFSGTEPAAMTEAEVEETIDAFAAGAAVARRLGFDAVEIMGSEGYLLDQFVSPLTNRRDDEWGGDADRRQRFPLAVLSRVKAEAGPDVPVVVRFSGADLMDGGTPADEVAGLARALALAGADALNVGVGWHEARVPTVQAVVPPGAWVPVAEAVKAAVKAAGGAAGRVPVMASNRINRLELAESILAGTDLDFVSMARPWLADAELLARARKGLPVNVCIGCNQACIDRSLVDEAVSCMVNPRAGRELELPAPSVIRPARRRLRAAVLGGGPAGLQAAHQLVLAGHEVDLYEAGDELGGQFRLARRVPGKEDYGATITYFAAELARLGVAVHLGRPIDDGDIDLLAGYDGVVVATGVRPRPLPLPGALAYPDAFVPGALGRRVAIVGGGGIAVDLAHLAAAEGRAVTILQRGTRTGASIGRSTRWAVLAELRSHRVAIETGVVARAVEPGGVRIAALDGGDERLVEADTVVVAAGQVHDGTTPALVSKAGVWWRAVGGARDVAGLDAVRAFAEGLDAAVELSRRG